MMASSVGPLFMEDRCCSAPRCLWLAEGCIVASSADDWFGQKADGPIPYVDNVYGEHVASALALVSVGRCRRGGVMAAARAVCRRQQTSVPLPIQWALVFAWCLLAILVQGLLRSTTPHSLGAIVASDTANSFYSVAVKTRRAVNLRRFRAPPSHVAAPRSKQSAWHRLLLFRAVTRGVGGSRKSWAWLIIGLVELRRLAAVPLLTRGDGRPTPRRLSAAILYLFTPATLYFVPLLNAVTPVVVLICAF